MGKSDTVLKEILEKDAHKVASALDFSSLAGKSIMITGVGGLIGVNCVTSLFEISKKVSGITIYAIVRSSPPPFLSSFLTVDNVTVFQGDLMDEHFVESLPKADIIMHTAGSGIPEQFLKDTLSSLNINTVTTFQLFEKLKKNGKFLFISSSEVYSGLPEGIYSEEQIGTINTNHPRACYIEGKKTGETICTIYRKMGVSAYAVRLSATYGPGMLLGDSRVVPSFIQKALNGKIDLLDSGNALRTFCYVSDAVELMWFVLLRGKQHLYNIGGIDHCKISDVAESIGTILHVSVTYPAINASISGAPLYVDIDIHRIMKESKKNTFVSLEEGLIHTIHWFKHLKK